MDLVVDLEKVTVALARPDDLGSLGVRVAAPDDASEASAEDVHRLHDVLVAAYVGRLDADGLAWLRPDAVVFHAAGQVDETWEIRFRELCEAASASGAADGDGALRAPVAWPTEAVAVIPS